MKRVLLAALLLGGCSYSAIPPTVLKAGLSKCEANGGVVCTTTETILMVREHTFFCSDGARYVIDFRGDVVR